MHSKTRRALFGLLIMAGAALFPTPAAAATTDTIVATHLDAPRGVAFMDGGLLVAEAGHGGPYCDGTPGGFGVVCIGTSSRISHVNPTTKLPVPWATGLFSAVEWHGGPPEPLGVDGISVRGGKLFGILALTPQVLDGVVCPPAPNECTEAKRQAGQLIAASGSGQWKLVAPVGSRDYEYTLQFPEPVFGPGAGVQPGTQEHDANPYGVLATEGGVYVADAGANTLDRVNGGHISILQHFPNRQAGFPSDEVPDCIASSGDALWVGTLAGRLFRVDEDGVIEVKAPKWLQHVTGCTSDKSGNLYFVNMFITPFPSPFSGNVVKYTPDSGAWSQVNGAPMNFPNMATVGPDGNLYVSADSICPMGGIPGLCTVGGTVHRLTLPHAEGDD